MPDQSPTEKPTYKPAQKPASPGEQRDRLLDNERAANRDQPRNFKDDALTDKVVSIEPDGTGPSPTGSMDPDRDRRESPDESALESLGRAVSAPLIDADEGDARGERPDSDQAGEEHPRRRR